MCSLCADYNVFSQFKAQICLFNVPSTLKIQVFLHWVHCLVGQMMQHITPAGCKHLPVQTRKTSVMKVVMMVYSHEQSLGCWIYLRMWHQCIHHRWYRSRFQRLWCFPIALLHKIYPARFQWCREQQDMQSPLWSCSELVEISLMHAVSTVAASQAHQGTSFACPFSLNYYNYRVLSNTRQIWVMSRENLHGSKTWFTKCLAKHRSLGVL